MKRTIDPVLGLLACGIVLLGSGAVLCSDSGPADSAARALVLWGRDQGLCSIVGMHGQEDARLAAELAATGEVLVHGLALEEAALERARAAITRRGLDGAVSIEHLPLAPLPYRDNLVNLMLVPHPAEARRAGFSAAEAMRVLAPFGKLLVWEAGQWRVTEKPLPDGMDQWTHNVHGPDGNRFSRDKVVHFPVGYRWHAGLPFNINNVKRQGNRYSATRAVAVADGRVFSFSDSVLENLKDAYFLGQGVDQCLTARDAFNGLLLWRKRIGRVYYGGLWYMNLAPLAVADGLVCTVSESGDLLVLDAATGREVRTIDTTFAPGEILIDRGVLVAATWQGGTWLGQSKRNIYERRLMHSAVPKGTVEAYELASGRRLWSQPVLATSIRAADGLVYFVRRQGPDELEESLRAKPADAARAQAKEAKSTRPTRPPQTILAVDLKTGQQRWHVAAKALSPKQHRREYLRIDAVGLGVATIVHEGWGGVKVSVLAARDGHVLLQRVGGNFPLLIDGAIHLGGKRYDPATGKELGSSPYSLGSTICTPGCVVNDIIVMNRGCTYRVGGKPVVYAGARGACSFGSIPAYGAFYTPQNWCMCCPPQISGFLCFGPVRSVPTEQEMTALVEPTRGPAFGESVAVAAVGGTAWPMARCDAARSAGTSAVAPVKLESIWQRRIPLPDLSTPLARNWREYLNPPLTGPTVAGAVVAAAVMDANQVVGLELATGKLLWRVTAGARIDSPPTLYRGVCLFGAHDGLVYAVSARDGRLRWKLRIAPRAQRMVSYGKVESPWPAVGSVLVADGVAYASAGRTQGSDGGIVVRAFDPLAGRLIWSAALPASGNPRSLRRNDLLVKTDDTLQLMTTRLDPKTGQIVPNTMLQALAKRTSLARQLQTEQRRLKTAQPEQKPQIEKRVAELKRQIQQAERQSGEIALWLGAGGRSCEGLLHWNWPRLGDRKYVRMNYGNVGGKLVSWDRTAVVRMVRDRQIALRAMGQVGPAGQPPRGPDLWSRSLPTDHQVTSLALAANAVICAGGVYAEDGEASGFVCLLARKDGKTLVARRLPAPVAYNGLAVVDHAICVSLVNGTVWLLGDRVSARPPSE